MDSKRDPRLNTLKNKHFVFLPLPLPRDLLLTLFDRKLDETIGVINCIIKIATKVYTKG